MDVNDQSQWDFEIFFNRLIAALFVRGRARVASAKDQRPAERVVVLFSLLEVEELDGKRRRYRAISQIRERPMVLLTGIFMNF